uniref:Uncharacterized protein n=1 Tax=Meloidogyne incognita TaxID=6306 RepID=A0A914KI30_MELIC
MDAKKTLGDKDKEVSATGGQAPITISFQASTKINKIKNCLDDLNSYILPNEVLHKLSIIYDVSFRGFSVFAMDDLNSPLLAELLKEIKAIKWSKFPLYFLVGESDLNVAATQKIEILKNLFNKLNEIQALLMFDAKYNSFFDRLHTWLSGQYGQFEMMLEEVVIYGNKTVATATPSDVPAATAGSTGVKRARGPDEPGSSQEPPEKK